MFHSSETVIFSPPEGARGERVSETADDVTAESISFLSHHP